MELLASLIWTCMLGLAVGNYATSFVFRLPRNESPFTKHPYCGGCGTMLGVKDLFPAFSWLFLKGRCRYCEMPIPAVYFWMEVFCALIFMFGVWSYGFSEAYILVVTGGTVGVTLWALEARAGRVFHSVLLLLAAIGLVYRTLLDGTTMDAFYGMIWGAALPMIWWRARMDKHNTTGESQRLVIPPALALGATAGVWLATFGLMVFVALWAVFALAQRLSLKRSAEGQAQPLLTEPFVAALMVLVLFPQALAWLQEAAITTTRALLGL